MLRTKADAKTAEPQDIFLTLSRITKDYFVNKIPYPALKGIDLSIAKKGFVCILGASGSGKTTLLNIIGGLDRYTSGDLFIEGESTKGYSSSDWDAYRNKRIGFIFQSYYLIPHSNILENVELPLTLGGKKSAFRHAKAKKALERVGLGDMLKKKPNQLSGGQQQRVAIARALVSDPDLVLADEPTGALDSATSVQIMDLLQEIAKERCVIMVTHNRALAEEYADRIIEMKDGLITSDSAPLSCEITPKEKSKKAKTSMPFWMSFQSALRNIKAKWGRSTLTSIACSIGIIGVGLVVATTSGFSSYVSQVETGIASSVPISISPTIYSVNTKSVTSPDEPSFPDDDEVHVYNTSSNLYVSHQNKFTTEYLDYLNRIMDDPTCPAYGQAMSIMYNRANLDFHFMTKDGLNGEHIRTINQYSYAGTTGSTIHSATDLPTYIMHELYGEEDAMSSLYDVIYGRFPTKSNEMVLIVDRYNRIEFSTLKSLGILASDTQYADLSDEAARYIDFSKIVADSDMDAEYKEYRCFKNSDFYQTQNDPVTFSVDAYDDVHYDIREGKFVGTEHKGKPIKAYSNPYSSYGENPYDAVYEDADDVYHPISCKIVGVIRPTEQSFLQLMPSSIGYLPSLTKIMSDDYAEGGPSACMAKIQSENWYVPLSYADDGVTKASNDGLEILNNNVLPLVQDMQEKSVSELSAYLTTTYINSAISGSIRYAAGYCSKYVKPSGTTWSVGTTTSVSTFLKYCHALGGEFDTSKVPAMSASSESISDWVNVFLSADLFSYYGEPSIVDCMAYLNAYSLVSSILVFPKSLTTKDALKAYLDAWNEGKVDADCITYSDLMSDVMGGLSAIITVVSAVLIVFASISLIVSSVMTAIITYIAVVERTQEIGVLRSCGGRKGDVRRLFESECVVVGGVSGVIGILVTYLLCWPINVILKKQFSAYVFVDIAVLSPWYALALVALSTLLAFLSGLIPSQIAANKDPVICLRS